MDHRIAHLPRPHRLARHRLDQSRQSARRSKTIIHHWINHDVFQVTRLYARSVGKIGKPVPHIWSWSPLDPNAAFGQPPHAMWGDMWHDLADRLPDDYEATLRREPHYGGRADTFIGWHFRCPGRYLPIPEGVTWVPPGTPSVPGGSELGKPSVPEGSGLGTSVPERSDPGSAIVEINSRRYLHLPCNRNARCLFLPLPCWTIADFKGASEGIPDIKPQWADIMNQPPACHRCWKIRRISLESPHGWNDFVTHISGGLLTGREVPRPMHIVPRERKRERRRVWSKTPTRRLQVQQLLLEGLKYREIAATLGITWNTVNNHTRRIYRDHDVHSRAELQQKLRPITPPPTPAAAAR